MSVIMTDLVLHPLPGRKWEVRGDFVVATKAGGRITVPDGFVCDLNSMPRGLWWVSTPADMPEAGVVHDYLYWTQVPRGLADAIYAEVLTELGLSSTRVALRYMALRLFGGRAYRSHAVA